MRNLIKITTMTPQVEQALSTALRSLDSQSLTNLKAHADAVDHEDHSSAHVIKKWFIGAVGGVFGPGMIWWVIKKIKSHK